MSPHWTIGDDDTWRWRIRLGIERQLHNITDAHAAILHYVTDQADAGDDQLSHAAVAAALHRGRRTVRDALGRGRALGLIDWTPRYERRPGALLWRRRPNVYRRTTPPSVARRRPDVRRGRDRGTLRRADRYRRKEERMDDRQTARSLAHFSQERSERRAHTPYFNDPSISERQQARILEKFAQEKAHWRQVSRDFAAKRARQRPD